jgi:hypothetical protein
MIHGFMKLVMAFWSGACLLSGIGMIVGGYSVNTNKIPTDDVNSGMICLMAVLLFCFWLFPMLFFIFIAYFTRPQAWDNKTQQPISMDSVKTAS